MNYRRTLSLLVMVIALVAAACSSDTSDTATTEAEATTTSAGSLGTDTTTPDTPDPETTTTTTMAVADPVFDGADPIEQITATSGGGMRPLLEWEAVDGAALYFVTVYNETGESYWAAVTVETETYVGGPLQIPEGRTGPNVAEGYVWSVVAEDADGNMLAASPRRPIAP